MKRLIYFDLYLYFNYRFNIHINLITTKAITIIVANVIGKHNTAVNLAKNNCGSVRL